VGETVAKKLTRHFGDIHHMQRATFDELIAIEDIGERIADSVLTWFARPEHQLLINRLEEKGLQLKSTSDEQPADGSLSGLTFVVSGVFEKHSRDEMKALIEANGGKNLGAISAKTSYLIAGDKMGSAKKSKAEKLGVPIINEDQFYDLLSSN